MIILLLSLWLIEHTWYKSHVVMDRFHVKYNSHRVYVLYCHHMNLSLITIHAIDLTISTTTIDVIV